MSDKIDHRKALDKIGTTGQIAELCEVKSQAVSKWKRDNKIPKARLMYLKEIKPEAFK